MNHLFLVSIAVLFLATGTAHATGPDSCAVVKQTRDGFLNVREAPTMKSKIVAKLHAMDLVWVDAYEDLIQGCDGCDIKGWTHIGGVQRSSGDGKPQRLRGWVGERYLKYVGYHACEPPSAGKDFDFIPGLPVQSPLCTTLGCETPQ